MKTISRQRAGLVALALVLGMAASTAMASDLVVSNVQVQQRPGTAIWDVTYDLQTVVGSQPVMVRLFLSIDGGENFTFQCQAVSGDVGAGVEPGMGLQIEWNAGVDWPGLVAPQCVLRVVADDSPYAEDFVYIPPGTFMMGSPEDEPGRWPWEDPQHQVTLTKGFYMSKYEVTEQRWYQVMGGTPTPSRLPKNYVSWDLAAQFCNTLSVQEGLTPAYTIHGPYGDVTWNQGANGYRLPTEAEWEYACRAGSTTAFANGPITHIYCDPLDPNLDAMGWYCGNTNNRQRVGQKQANAWGLYDMHGNLWEWVWCGWRTYTSGEQYDPVTSPGPFYYRLMRGGYWDSYALYSRSAFRSGFQPGGVEAIFLGFRLARSAP